MDITITFDQGRWMTDPSPAIVVRGTEIRFVLRAPRSQLPRLRWTVHFRGRSPFPDHRRLVVVSRNTLFGSVEFRLREALADGVSSRRSEDVDVSDLAFDHRASTEPARADAPGEYKYDLAVENADSGEALGDDDPYLYVLDGIARIRL